MAFGKLFLTASAAAMAAAGAAQAQDGGAGDPAATSVPLAPVSVYGVARDGRALEETPAAVSVMDEDEIARRQATTYEELLGDIPGVTIGGGPRGIAQEPNIRGFTDEQLVIRVDGARQNFNLAHRGRFFIDPEALKRVEVVRGGASTLHGSGALGGVILLETKDAADILGPDETWGGRVGFGFASQGPAFLGSLTLAGQAGDFDVMGFVSYRPMAGDLKDGDGETVKNSELDAATGIVKFGFTPGDHRFELSYQRYEDEGITPPNANAAATDTTVVNRTLSFQTLRGEWTFSPDGSDMVDVSALLYITGADVSEDRIADGRLDETTYVTIGGELVNRSKLNIGVPVKLSYGVEGFQDSQEATRNGAARESSPDATARYAAAFVQGDIELGHGVIVTPGLRLDWFSLNPDGEFEDRSEHQLSPRIAVQWKPAEGVQLWASASRSFRAPSLTELYNDGVHFSVDGFSLGPGTNFTGNNLFVPTPDLEPEKSDQLEVGARYTAHDLAGEGAGDKLTFSAGAYYAKVEDFIDTTVLFIDFGTAAFNPITGNLDVSGSTTNANVDAYLWGFEAEIAYDAGPWFASAGLTIPRGRAEAGGALGSIPQDRLVVTAGFRPMEDVEIGARATLMDGQDDVPDGSEPTPGVVVFDVFASWTPSDGPLEGARFTAGVDNVLDRTWRIHPNGLNQSGLSAKLSASIPF